MREEEMKKNIRVFLFTLICTVPLSAQNLLNVYADIGYGFGMGGHFLGSSNTFLEEGLTESEDQFLNLGRGLKLELGTGYFLTPYMEGRVSLDFTFGVPSPTVQSKRKLNDVTTHDTLFEYSYFSWGFTTIVAPYFEVLELIDAYLGVGLIFNFASAGYDLTISQLQDGSLVEHYAEVDFDVPFALGFTGLMGFELPLSSYLYFFSEIRFEQINRKIREEKVTEISSELQDFVETIHYERDAVDRNPPPNIPASNWGLRFGLKLWLY